MSGFRRTLTSSDVEDGDLRRRRMTNGMTSSAVDDQRDNDASSTTSTSSLSASSLDWSAASSSMAGQPGSLDDSISPQRGGGHRRYRSGSQPDIIAPGGRWAAVRRAWSELSLVARIVILLVTPFAARQLGSLVSRRLWSRFVGPVVF